jgi:hypothetical protein
MVIIKNNGSTIEGERRVTLFVINCGIIQVLMEMDQTINLTKWISTVKNTPN